MYRLIPGCLLEGTMVRDVHAIILATEKGYPSYDFYKKNGFSQIDDLCFMGTDF